MARLPRLCIPNELHLVVLKGHNRQSVFLDDDDRKAFLAALREAAHPHGLRLHGYVMLDDQVQLLVTPSEAQSLAKAIQAVGRRYVGAFNRKHGRSGTLWEGRYRAAVLESERYFLSALQMMEMAPVAEGLAYAAGAWAWSSAAHHLGLRRDPLISDHPLYWALGNTPFDREAAYGRLHDRGVDSADATLLLQSASKCWALGSAEFLARLSGATARPLTPRPRGRPKKVGGRAIDDVSPITDDIAAVGQ